MGKFVEIDSSIFDRDLCLDPFQVLEPLYDDPEVIGFQSEGMNFCIRFDDCRSLISAHEHVAREPIVTPENQARELEYARKYPHRAWHFQHGLADLDTKALFNRFLIAVLDRVKWTEVGPAFTTLRRSGRHDDYLDEIETLPLQMMLKAWGFSFDSARITALHAAGVALNKSFDNFNDEELIAKGDQGLAVSDRYFHDQFKSPRPGTLLFDYAREVDAKGIDPAHAVAILVSFNNGLTNTLSVSTAFALRNILRYPEAIAPLREDPALLDNDNVILEFLRRDNHVKSLSRQVHSPFSMRGLALQPGDALSIFYPGVNLDPTHWHNPTMLDFSRTFTRDNHNLFGGSRYACIGNRIALRYFKCVLSGMINALPPGSRLIEEEIETDNSWLTERIITRIPVVVP